MTKIICSVCECAFKSPQYYIQHLQYKRSRLCAMLASKLSVLSSEQCPATSVVLSTWGLFLPTTMTHTLFQAFTWLLRRQGLIQTLTKYRCRTSSHLIWSNQQPMVRQTCCQFCQLITSFHPLVSFQTLHIQPNGLISGWDGYHNGLNCSKIGLVETTSYLTMSRAYVNNRIRALIWSIFFSVGFMFVLIQSHFTLISGSSAVSLNGIFPG